MSNLFNGPLGTGTLYKQLTSSQAAAAPSAAAPAAAIPGPAGSYFTPAADPSSAAAQTARNKVLVQAARGSTVATAGAARSSAGRQTSTIAGGGTYAAATLGGV